MSPSSWPEPDTPYLLVDQDRLDRNVTAMAVWAAEHGVALRPHAKTHKCAQLARRQVDAGACGLTVATLGEAEAFAAAGFRDLFIAYPLWLTGGKAERFATLATDCRLRIGVDSAEAASRIAGAIRGSLRSGSSQSGGARSNGSGPGGSGPGGSGPGGSPIEVLIEVDSGHHRSGVAPPLAGDVAAASRAAGLDVVGVFTFPGHGYGPGPARRSAARDESRALGRAAESLRRVGIEPAVVSGGSTPTAAFADPGVLTEIRPGVYPFNDAQQVELGSCGFGDVALTAASTVVSVAGSRIVLDAGSKVLGGDRPAWTSGFGRILEFPEARIVALSEHHATVQLPDDADVPPLGSILRVVPNHVCAAVNLVDDLIVHRRPAGAERAARAAEATEPAHERWQVIARGANS